MSAVWLGTLGRLCAVGVLVVPLAACGGNNDDASPAAGGDTAEVADGDAPDGGDDDDDGGGGGDSFGVFTVDGTDLRYAMSGLEYSQFEGISDITFEKCDPSFFGAGLFAIGYPVDENGELILSGNGDIDGIVNIQLPSDPADTELMDIEMDLDHGPSGLDVRYRPSADTGETTFSLDENRATGTIVLANSRSEPTVVDFEIVCAGG